MAEASLKSNNPTKKRKVDTKASKALKQSTILVDGPHQVTRMTPTPAEYGYQEDHLHSISTASATTTTAANVFPPEEFKRTYHIGGKKYVVFHGPEGIIEKIYFKEWDGKRTTSGLSINISKLIMILHNSDYINQALVKICNDQPGIDVKVHIGELFYLTCNSPYKIVQIRRWKKIEMSCILQRRVCH